MTFYVLVSSARVFGPNFPNLPKFVKYTKTGITQPSDGLYPGVRIHLMWNMEFNTLNEFLRISVHDVGY